MQLKSDSKKEVIKRKLICWLDNLHLRLFKEKLGYQFDPAYRCSSNMILSKEIYLKLQGKFPSISKMIKACGLITSLDSGMMITDPMSIWHEEFCTLLRSSQSNFPNGIEKTGNVMVNGIKMLKF